MSPRTYRPGDPEYFHATPPDSDAREVRLCIVCWHPATRGTKLGEVLWCNKHGPFYDTPGDPASPGSVTLPLSLAQRILAALDHLADARVDTNYTAASGNARSLAAELRAVIGK